MMVLTTKEIDKLLQIITPEQFTFADKILANSPDNTWPFPVSNGLRTEESQALLNIKRHVKTVDDFSDLGEALF